MVQLTEEDKYAIMAYMKIGYSCTKIADVLKIDVNTVYLWLRRYKKFKTTDRKTGSGGVKKMTNDLIIVVMQEMSNNRYYSLDEIHNILRKSNNISKYMIEKILKNSGYIYGIAPKRFPLTEEHKQRRLNFAMKHRLFDWTKVLFTFF